MSKLIYQHLRIDRIVTFLGGISPLLTIALDVFNLTLFEPLRLMAEIYKFLRSFVFEYLGIDWFFGVLAKLISVDLSNVNYWEDVIVLLVLYTGIQVKDAWKREGVSGPYNVVNPVYASIWRAIAGFLGILSSILIMLVISQSEYFTAALSLAVGISVGLLVFRLLHPFQIAFDMGWKALNGKKEEKGVFNLVKEIARTKAARDVYMRKLSAALELVVTVGVYLTFYGAWRLASAGAIRDDIEYLFFLIYLGAICLFQAFMARTKVPPKEGFGLAICKNGSIERAIYISTEAGNFRIARELWWLVFWAFLLVLGLMGVLSQISG